VQVSARLVPLGGTLIARGVGFVLVGRSLILIRRGLICIRTSLVGIQIGPLGIDRLLINGAGDAPGARLCQAKVLHGDAIVRMTVGRWPNRRLPRQYMQRTKKSVHILCARPWFGA
jgi:hypothetical protein